MAIAHPVLDLVARHPEFLVAHHLSKAETWALAAVLLGVTAGAGLVVAGVGRLSRVAGEFLLNGAVTALVFIGMLPITKRLPIPDWAMLLAAGIGAAVTAIAFRRLRRLPEATRYLGAVPIVVAAWFLFSLQAAPSATAQDQPAPYETIAPTPVVLLILDELPLASLIDTQGVLLADRFPGFARLAADGVWYRNAITVETGTTEAVPSILTGRRVERGTLPLARNHPDTLMTVLSGTHDVTLVETVTNLCLPQICAPPPIESRAVRWRRVAEDVAVIFGHAISPPRIASRLPSLDEGWSGFLPPHNLSDDQAMRNSGGTVVPGPDRQAGVTRFIDFLRKAEGPSLNVAHLLLPHRPWEFLPSGEAHQHPGVPGYDGRGWGPDPFHTAAGYQLHLLQVEYVDSVVGEMLDVLEERGVYDSTLVVVTADHGVVIQAGVENMRQSTPERIGSILAVPLFVKYPDSVPRVPPPGTVSDVRALTTDIVPTVLDVLTSTPPTHLDGRSLLSDEPARRGSIVVELGTGATRVGTDGKEKLAVAADKETWFPDGNPWTLTPDPRLRQLLGTPPDKLWPQVTGRLAADIDVAIPSLIAGSIHSTSALAGDELVVVASRDQILGITKIHPPDGKNADFAMLLEGLTFDDLRSLEATAVDAGELLAAAE